ncbi:conserved hypothetical protein, partial [Ricinus communis]
MGSTPRSGTAGPGRGGVEGTPSFPVLAAARLDECRLARDLPALSPIRTWGPPPACPTPGGGRVSELGDALHPRGGLGQRNDRDRRLDGAAVEAVQQVLPLRAHGDDVGQLHVAVAADAFRQAGQLGRDLQLVGAQAAQQLVHQGLVIADQLALDAALLGLAEQ